MSKSDSFCFIKLYFPIILSIFVAVGLLLFSTFGVEKSMISKNGRATYDYSPTEFISFDWEREEVFYYTNQLDGIYLKGSLEKVGVNQYLLISQQYENIIPRQIISFESEEITLQVQNQKKMFVKTRDVIEIIAGPERYK